MLERERPVVFSFQITDLNLHVATDQNQQETAHSHTVRCRGICSVWCVVPLKHARVSCGKIVLQGSGLSYGAYPALNKLIIPRSAQPGHLWKVQPLPLACILQASSRTPQPCAAPFHAAHVSSVKSFQSRRTAFIAYRDATT